MITLDTLRKLVTPKVILKSRPKGSRKRYKYYHTSGVWLSKKIGAAMFFEKDVPEVLKIVNEAYPHLEIMAVKV